MEKQYYYEKAPLIDNDSLEKPTARSFRGVTNEGRKFNDILFGILFVLMFVGMAAVNVVGFIKGDPSKLLPTSAYVDTHEIENKAEFWFQDSVAHLKRDVDVLGGSIGLAFILGLVWIQLMRTFTKLFIYLTLVLGTLAVIAGGIYSFMLGLHKQNESLKIFSYCLFGVAFLIVVAAIFLRKKINLTCALFTECCKGVQHNPALFAVASLVFAMLAAFVAYWVAGFIFLYSIPAKNVEFHEFKQMPAFNTQIRYLMYFNLFGFFWTVSFLTALFQMSIAGSIATWYFSRDVQSGGAVTGSPTLRGFGYALSKSFGSLAFGSLIVAVVETLNFLVSTVKKTPGNNKVVKIALCFIQCLLSCVQGILRFVNRYAYIHIAMHGDGFCSSARNVYDLISRNSFSAVIVDTLGEFVLFVGKLLGTSACTIFSLFLLQHLGREISPVTIAAVVITSFAVFNLFANIVGSGVDTVLVCYLEDLERNKGSNLYIEPSLHDLLQQKARDTKSVN